MCFYISSKPFAIHREEGVHSISKFPSHPESAESNFADRNKALVRIATRCINSYIFFLKERFCEWIIFAVLILELYVCQAICQSICRVTLSAVYCTLLVIMVM